MIKEVPDSRSLHITRDGMTITQRFSCAWEDIDRGYDDTGRYLPVIGTPWSFRRQELTVTDIQTDPRPNSNTECTVICVYSSGGQPWPQNLTDTIASLKDTYDFQISPQTEDAYYDYGYAAMKSWETQYKLAFSTATAIPERFKPDAHPVLTIRGLVAEIEWDRIENKIGKINSDYFLRWYTTRYVDMDTYWLYPEAIILKTTFDDRKKWLYAGFHAEQAGRDTGSSVMYPSYEIQHTLIYEKDGWNNVWGINDAGAGTVYTAYQTTNFTPAISGLILPAANNFYYPTGLRG